LSRIQCADVDTAARDAVSNLIAVHACAVIYICEISGNRISYNDIVKRRVGIIPNSGIELDCLSVAGGYSRVIRVLALRNISFIFLNYQTDLRNRGRCGGRSGCWGWMQNRIGNIDYRIVIIRVVICIGVIVVIYISNTHNHIVLNSLLVS